MSPMPPPRASTQGPRDRQVLHELGQIVRALEASGAMTAEDLRVLVGGQWWERDRFDRALALAIADGVVFRTDEGTLATP